MASLTFKWIDGDRWHLASNYGEGEYPLKMDVYLSADRPRHCPWLINLFHLRASLSKTNWVGKIL